jgi:hypothetical protein
MTETTLSDIADPRRRRFLDVAAGAIAAFDYGVTAPASGRAVAAGPSSSRRA